MIDRNTQLRNQSQGNVSNLRYWIVNITGKVKRVITKCLGVGWIKNMSPPFAFLCKLSFDIDGEKSTISKIF